MVTASVLLGGDSPWVCRIIGITPAPQIGTLYNEAIWDSDARVWMGKDVVWTTESDHEQRTSFLLGTPSGWSVDPVVVIARCRVVMCILHCCMALGRLQMANIERFGLHHTHPHAEAHAHRKRKEASVCEFWASEYDNPAACPALPASKPGHHPTNTTNPHCGSCHQLSGTHCRSPRRSNGPQLQRVVTILYTIPSLAPARKCLGGVLHAIDAVAPYLHRSAARTTPGATASLVPVNLMEAAGRVAPTLT